MIELQQSIACREAARNGADEKAVETERQRIIAFHTAKENRSCAKYMISIFFGKLRTDRCMLSKLSNNSAALQCYLTKQGGLNMRSGTHRLLAVCVAVCFCGILVLGGVRTEAQTAGVPSSGSSSLVSRLSKELSITHSQARGGAGALFSLAKQRLTADEFSKVSAAVPGMSGLLKAAPAVGGNSELSGLESSLPGNMGRMVEVAGAFHKLGLSPEMAGKFLPVMSKFVEARGGSSTASLLEKALK